MQRGPEWKASEQLSEAEFDVFSEQVRRDYKRAQQGIIRARNIIADQEDVVAIRLRTINELKAYAYKHGVDLDGV